MKQDRGGGPRGPKNIRFSTRVFCAITKSGNGAAPP